MFFVYWALWVILNGRLTLEIAVIGALIAAALTLFSAKLNRHTLRHELTRPLHSVTYLAYVWRLLVEIIRSAVAVIRIVLDPSREVEPQLMYFHSGITDSARNVILANSITLTPGTITVGLRGDQFHVHALDKSFLDGIDDNALLHTLRTKEAADSHAE